MGEALKTAGSDAFGHAVQVLGGDTTQYDLDLAQKREEDRRERVIARLVFCNGSLMDYHHQLSAGFVKPISESQPTNALPVISIFNAPRLVPGFTPEEMEAIKAAGLDPVLKWQDEVGFKGKIEFALWLPDLGHNRQVKTSTTRPNGRGMPQGRKPAGPTKPQYTQYPPQPVVWNNALYRDQDLPKLYEEEVGAIQLIAIIDCEKTYDLQSLCDAFGAPV